MKGPSKKPRIDLGIGWSEFFMFLAGLTVVVGLWMESGAEWRNAWNEKRWPANRMIGSALVAVGVFAEACLGISGARSSRNKELESNERIAELNNETARLRRLSSYRTIGDSEAFAKALKPFSGTRYSMVIERDSTDAAILSGRINTCLRRAGWIITGPLKPESQLGHGVVVLTICRLGSPKIHSTESIALADCLDREHIAVTLSVSQAGEPEPEALSVLIGPRPETIDMQEFIRQEFARQLSLVRPVTPPQA